MERVPNSGSKCSRQSGGRVTPEGRQPPLRTGDHGSKVN